MRLLLKLIGLGLILLGVYMLGQNILFTTNPSPYWWRGIAADTSIFCLVVGVVMFFAFSGFLRYLGAGFVGFGIVFVFASSRAVLSPTTLWQFFVSTVAFVLGFQLLTTGRIRF